MDLRKQKRLGPAPIASFEKSFEDTTSTQTVGSSEQSSTYLAEITAKDINRNGEAMESHESKNNIKTVTTTNTSTEKGHQPRKQQQQQEPQSSISISASSGSIKSKNDTTFKRPPPLKATTMIGTTTLVSSGEQQTIYRGATTLTTPSTPRIELSRASSSSHHEEDSRESSPENVFEQVGTGTLQETISLGFREEGALELRSSTEELYFMDPEHKKEEQEKMQMQQAKRSSPHIFKFDEHQSYLQQHQRKDSASSEVAALLCISGRTSRISSVGSQGSAVSRLSAISGVSRSPSPHRMLMETSFCGPKPLENVIDGVVLTTVEPKTTELLEQALLSRIHDPTQAVLAEGIKVESSPKKKPVSLSNGDTKLAAKIAIQNRPTTSAKSLTMGAQRRSTKSPGQMVVGKTPSGTEYIRINLKPDHMYDDKGIAPNERVVEAPNTIPLVYSKGQKKPASLSLTRNIMDENRLTPTASPKPTRQTALTKEPHGSRSPSPATVSVSRKSSFSSLFRLGGKDSPDSPRERSRSRSKSKERQTPQSQNVTPSKQKSVLAIFKPGSKRGSSAGTDTKSSKSSSPIDAHELVCQPQSRSKTPLPPGTGSRPASRLRYYDEPVEGYIHIPLHTPPEEKETKKLLQGIQQLNVEPIRPQSAPVTASQLAAAAAALKPVAARKQSGSGIGGFAAPRLQQIEKLQRIENLDAIHTLPHDDETKERTWSLEVNRHSSQDSQETVGSVGSYASAIQITARSNLANVAENVVQENGVAAAAEIHRLPSLESTGSVGQTQTVETVATVNTYLTDMPGQAVLEDTIAKEKRRLLFATRLGSGSQEQIFSTQFSISKTESQSSQLSEQVQESQLQSPAIDNFQRQGTVIRRCEEEVEVVRTTVTTKTKESIKRRTSIENTIRQKSISTSEDEKPVVHTTVSAVVLRRKDSSDEMRRKSRSTSEEDADSGGIGGSKSNQRHSRYLENFDVRKKYHENVPRKPKRQSISETSKTETETVNKENIVPTRQERKPMLPQPPPPSTAPSPSPPSVSRSPSATPTKHSPTRSHSQSPVTERSKSTPVKPPRSTTPTRRSVQTTPQSPSPPATISAIHHVKKQIQGDRQSVHSAEIESSESERDSDIAGGGNSSAATDAKRRHLPRHVGVIEDHESTGLVSQESFDDELPYIPTTLPEERAQGVSIIPMKERANMELKTCPVDRPRSTTPLNPSHLEEYCGIVIGTPQEQPHEISGSAPVRGEKLRISLPRKDSTKSIAQSSKSPRRTSNTSGKSWFEFAEEGLRATGGNLERKDSNKQLLQKQQQQPKDETKTKKPTSKAITTTVQTMQITTTSGSTSTQRKLSGHWIDFENIPEKRKPAKRITTLPRDSLSGSTNIRKQSPSAATKTAGESHHVHHSHSDIADGKLHYDYVKPEDCQCECHEVERETAGAASASATSSSTSKGLKDVDLLPQGEDLLPLLEPETLDGIEPSDSSREYSYYTDDEMEVPMAHSGSSRSKSSSSKMDEFPRRDVSHSPRNKKFPDNKK
ncbi:microtubule-associated protein futsch [Teleopsis dalmanni]|uniref:microtubule-associated protein futsch n=1 Tax=Teleopsis dalmanni TaxID=139649 RepID=UPI0018CF83F5|nr:microtubule-associated protein futsch [Teleopsis dalmanni]